MFDTSRFRAALIHQRGHYTDPARRDEMVTGTMAEAMVQATAAGNSGVTRSDLERCGFLPDELDRLGAAAADIAAVKVHGQPLAA